jgi:hypothetical protein
LSTLRRLCGRGAVPAHRDTSGSFGETANDHNDHQDRAAAWDRNGSLVATVDRLQPHLDLAVTHAGIDDARVAAFALRVRVMRSR